MSKTKIFLILLLIVAIVGFFVWQRNNSNVEVMAPVDNDIVSQIDNEPAPDTQNQNRLLQRVQNNSYDLGSGPITLTNGEYESGMESATIGATSFGDINNDGEIDAAVILGFRAGNSLITVPFVVIQTNGNLNSIRVTPELATTNPYFDITNIEIISGGTIQI